MLRWPGRKREKEQKSPQVETAPADDWEYLRAQPDHDAQEMATVRRAEEPPPAEDGDVWAYLRGQPEADAELTAPAGDAASSPGRAPAPTPSPKVNNAQRSIDDERLSHLVRQAMGLAAPAEATPESDPDDDRLTEMVRLAMGIPDWGVPTPSSSVDPALPIAERVDVSSQPEGADLLDVALALGHDAGLMEHEPTPASGLGVDDEASEVPDFELDLPPLAAGATGPAAPVAPAAVDLLDVALDLGHEAGLLEQAAPPELETEGSLAPGDDRLEVTLERGAAAGLIPPEAATPAGK